MRAVCVQTIIGMLKEAFPEHCFLGEESGGSAGEERLSDEPTWIIDPIDGTTNFVHTYTPVISLFSFCVLC